MKKYILFVFIQIIPLTVALAEQRPIVITYLRQTHKSPLVKKDEQIFEADVARSQFLIFNQLKKNPSSTVFVEGHLTRSTQASIRAILQSRNLDRLFDVAKIPKFYNQLSREQQLAFQEVGGAEIALYFGLIGKIMPTSNESILSFTSPFINSINNVPAEFREEMFSQAMNFQPIRDRIIERREIAALRIIQAYAAASDYLGEPLALVFGSAHEFQMRRDYSIYFGNFCEDLIWLRQDS